MVRDALIELFPPDVPRLVRWRLAVSLALAMFCIHIAWACGLMPNASGFARADDVDEKISAAVDTLYKEIGKVAKQQADTDEVVKDIRAEQIATRLRELRAVLCNATDHEDTQRLSTDIETAQRAYKKLTGERYPAQGCEEQRQYRHLTGERYPAQGCEEK